MMAKYQKLLREWSQKFNIAAPALEIRPIAKKIIRKRRTTHAVITETLMGPAGQYHFKTNTIVLDPVWGGKETLRHEFAHHLQNEYRQQYRIGGIGGRGVKAGIESNVRKLLRMWGEE